MIAEILFCIRIIAGLRSALTFRSELPIIDVSDSTGTVGHCD